MIVETDDAIGVAKPKPKSITPCTLNLFRALSKLHVIARNSDWFIALFAPVVIGWNNYFGVEFSAFI